MTCNICGESCGCELSAPTSPAALLSPGIRARLKRYGSVNRVRVDDDPAGDCIIVGYGLVTGEVNFVRIPLAWWRNDEYARMLDAVDKDLR